MNKVSSVCSGLVKAVDKKKILLDTLCAILLALCPLLQNYKGIFVDARATALIILAPYILIRFWLENKVNWWLVLPLICFGVCKIFDDGTSIAELGREGLVCLFLLAAASGVVNTKVFIRAITSIALVASALILIQYVCYYIFDFHLQLAPTSLFLKSSQQWVGLAQTGKISILGNPMKMYRPSAFFLEPAHMAIYCTPSVLFLLLKPNFSKRRGIAAAIVTLGVFACTSGLGIVLCVGIWFLFLAFYFGETFGDKPISLGKIKIKGISIKEFSFKGIPFGKKRIAAFKFKGYYFRPINVAFVLSMFVALILAYICVPVFRNSINRIIFTNGGYNAIAGRTNSGMKAVAGLQGFEWLVGKAVPGPESEKYMSAFYQMIYKYGLIGFGLSYVFYVTSLIKLKREYFWMALMVLGLSYFSVHTHGSAYLLFFCFLLLEGHKTCGTDDPKNLAISIHPLAWKNKD